MCVFPLQWDPALLDEAHFSKKTKNKILSLVCNHQTDAFMNNNISKSKTLVLVQSIKSLFLEIAMCDMNKICVDNGR